MTEPARLKLLRCLPRAESAQPWVGVLVSVSAGVLAMVLTGVLRSVSVIARVQVPPYGRGVNPEPSGDLSGGPVRVPTGQSGHVPTPPADDGGAGRPDSGGHFGYLIAVALWIGLAVVWLLDARRDGWAIDNIVGVVCGVVPAVASFLLYRRRRKVSSV